MDIIKNDINALVRNAISTKQQLLDIRKLIDALEHKDITTDVDIDNIGDTLINLNNKITTNASNISTINSTLQEHNNNISTNTSNISTINSTLQEHNNNISTINETIITQGSSIDELKETVKPLNFNVERKKICTLYPNASQWFCKFMLIPLPTEEGIHTFNGALSYTYTRSNAERDGNHVLNDISFSIQRIKSPYHDTVQATDYVVKSAYISNFLSDASGISYYKLMLSSDNGNQGADIDTNEFFGMSKSHSLMSTLLHSLIYHFYNNTSYIVMPIFHNGYTGTHSMYIDKYMGDIDISGVEAIDIDTMKERMKSSNCKLSFYLVGCGPMINIDNNTWYTSCILSSEYTTYKQESEQMLIDCSKYIEVTEEACAQRDRTYTVNSSQRKCISKMFHINCYNASRVPFECIVNNEGNEYYIKFTYSGTYGQNMFTSYPITYSNFNNFLNVIKTENMDILVYAEKDTGSPIYIKGLNGSQFTITPWTDDVNTHRNRMIWFGNEHTFTNGVELSAFTAYLTSSPLRYYMYSDKSYGLRIKLGLVITTNSDQTITVSYDIDYAPRLGLTKLVIDNITGDSESNRSLYIPCVSIVSYSNTLQGVSVGDNKIYLLKLVAPSNSKMTAAHFNQPYMYINSSCEDWWLPLKEMGSIIDYPDEANTVVAICK